jgi:hypothetical protein
MSDDTTDLPPAPEPEDVPGSDAPLSDEDTGEIGGDVDGVAKPKKKKGKKKGKKTVVVEVVPSWVRWAAVATALVLVALAVVAVGQSGRVSDLKAEARDRKAAERVAGEFAETLFTFDSSSPTANLDRLKDLATDAYKPKVDDARQTALAGSTQGGSQASMTARVIDVYVTELDGDTAHAVTRAQWLLNAEDQTLTLDLYLQLDVKLQDGRWKVDTVNAIAAKQPAGSVPGGTTSTTAPGATSTTVATTSTTAG